MLIESGLLPIKANILSRQFKFFQRFSKSMLHNSSRSKVFQQIQDKDEAYIQHDIHIIQKYTSKDEIYFEFRDGIKQNIKTLPQNGYYKYQIYLKFNPQLVKSPFRELPHPFSNKIIKFRLGSHSRLPIETGRWSRTPREQRLCTMYGVIGEETHYFNECIQIKRNISLPQNFEQIWQHPSIFTLFSRMMEIDIL